MRFWILETLFARLSYYLSNFDLEMNEQIDAIAVESGDRQNRGVVDVIEQLEPL